MKEFIDKTSKRFIRIDVIEPVTITTKEHIGWSSSFTTYLVKINTNHWAFSLHNSEVRRRFSEFCWLRSKLVNHHPNKVVPPLPPKRYFHMTKYDPKVIETRCNDLEIFIQRIVRSFVFLSDAALHLFLQSELTIEEIEAKLNEEIKPHYVKRINFTDGQGTKVGKGVVEFKRSTSSSSAASSAGSSAYSDIDSDRISSSGDNGSDLDLDLERIVESSHTTDDDDYGIGKSDLRPNETALNTKEFDFSE